MLHYSLAEIDAKHKTDMEAKGKTWKPNAHSLPTLFEDFTGKHSATLNDRKRCLIELGDEKISW